MLALAASPAVAGDTEYIHPWCGDVDVPAGETIVVRWGWAADTKELVDLFLVSGRYFFKMDRKPVGNTGQYWGPSLDMLIDLDGDGDNEWVAYWEYPLGALAVGETHEFFSFHLLRDRITDGLDLDGDGVDDMYGPGQARGAVSAPQPPWRCTVTAVSP